MISAPRSEIAALLKAATALHREGNLAEAERLYAEVLSHDPDQCDALHLLGVIATQRGDAAHGASLIERAVAARPQFAAARVNLANALRALGRNQEALFHCEAALARDATLVKALRLRAQALLAMERPADAVIAAKELSARIPDDADAHRLCGDALRQSSALAEAVASYERAIALAPGDPSSHLNLGSTLYLLGRHEDAVAAFEKSAALAPDFAEAHANRSLALFALGRFEEALAAAERATTLKPEYAIAHQYRGNALQALAQPQAALAGYVQATACDPADAGAHFDHAMCLLSLGHFAEGWRGYEWRKRLPKPLGVRSGTIPDWTGAEPIAGRTLLLYAEQGLGDTIQFCRLATLVMQRGARTILAVPDALVRLAGTLDPGIAVVSAAQDVAGVDYQCALMSLPHVLRLETLPTQVPYLRAEPQRIAHWRRILGERGFKIGLCWQGSRNRIDAGRSFSLSEIAPVLQHPDVRLFSLQKGPGAEEVATLAPGVVETLDSLDGGGDAFVDTAAVMAQLDLVISSDTAIAHLAGALGRPVWIGLKHVPDWRWGLAGVSTPWYPSARLFRQPRRNDWRSVFAEMKSVLLARLERRA